MRVKFWGTRGSLPVAMTADMVRQKLIKAFNAAIGVPLVTPEAIEDFVDTKLPFQIAGAFGGHSSCVQLETGSADFVMLDVGSGARPFGNYSMQASAGKGRYHIFLSHPHWDHIMGFPFFIPAYVPGNRITIYGGHDSLRDVFSAQQRAPFFPVDFSVLDAEIDFVRLKPGQCYDIAGTTVSMMKQVHGGDSYGYRFAKDGKIVVYATDAEHKLDNAGQLQEVIRFFQDADAVIFDAMYSLADAMSVREDWGHSSNMVGVELCQSAKAKRICLFHHEPNSDDEKLMDIHRETKQLEEIIRDGSPLEIITTYDGLELLL
jgi:phosphoribosyl 1,2-cyclic phosphodiesterase